MSIVRISIKRKLLQGKFIKILRYAERTELSDPVTTCLKLRLYLTQLTLSLWVVVICKDIGLEENYRK